MNTEQNFDAFNFDSMVAEVGKDPFAQTANKYAKDERFYTLAKDKDGNGAALIRFLPDSEKGMIQKMMKINTTISKNGKKRFVNEYTPATIGQPCPFQEKWQELWNSGEKEDAKLFGRSIVYVANIKILKDPANPENEGKVFLYQFSGAMNTKLQTAIKPSETDIALGKTAKQLFNPLAGNSFRLVAQKGANGQINYDAAEVVPEVDGIYSTVEEALTDIKENTFKLSSLIAPEAFMTYEKLQEKFKWVTFADQETPAQTVNVSTNVEVAQNTPATPEVQATPGTQTTATPQVETSVETKTETPANDNLDDLLKGLVG